MSGNIPVKSEFIWLVWRKTVEGVYTSRYLTFDTEEGAKYWMKRNPELVIAHAKYLRVGGMWDRMEKNE